MKHSRSPLIHNYWLDVLGIEGEYDLIPVPPGAFASLTAEIGRDGFVGANITVPHKEAAFRACDRRTPVAEVLGAVNVLWRENGLLCGDNTDVFGFLANLDEFAPGWADRDERRLFWEPEAARAQSFSDLLGEVSSVYASSTAP